MLLVPAAWPSPARPGRRRAVALAAELRRLAGWLGLDAVAPPAAGDLAAPLAAALRSRTGVP